MLTRVSSHAQKSPTRIPKVAVEKPRREKPFMRVSTKMKKPARRRPPTIPSQIGTSRMVAFELTATATPASSQTSR